MRQQPKWNVRYAARVARSILHEARNADGLSHFAEADRKSKSRVFRDMLRWYVAHGEHCGNYFQYGLDVLGANADEYVSSRELRRFRAKVDDLGGGPGDSCNTLILRDKVLFNKIMEYHGIAVPRLYGQISSGRIHDPVRRPVGTIGDLLPAGSPAIVKERFGEQAGKLTGGPEGSFFLINVPPAAARGFPADSGSTGEPLYLQTGDWIVQEVLQQVEMLARFNASSVNTMRIFTFTAGSGVRVPRAILKVGKSGNFVDNVQWGGSYCEIDVAAGCLTGRIKHTKGAGETTVRLMGGLLSAGQRIPFFAEAVELAKAAHGVVEHVPSIGWDVAITESGPVVIEGNDNWGVLTFQLFGGARDFLHQLDPSTFPARTGH